MNLTDPGKALEMISSNYGIPELSDNERVFFSTQAWNSNLARRLFFLQKDAEKGIQLHNNDCGTSHYKIRVAGDTKYCAEPHNVQMEYTDLALTSRYKYHHGESTIVLENAFYDMLKNLHMP